MQILSELDAAALAGAIRTSRYSKWWSACFFRTHAIPHLNAALLDEADLEDPLEAVTAFMAFIGAEKVCIRADGGRETASYWRGGVSVDADQAGVIIESLRPLGRAIILLEPTNRFSNRFTLNITLDAAGQWAAEGLPCGFDTSDLQRSLVSPLWCWQGTRPVWMTRQISDRNSEFWTGDSIPHEERVAQRLANIVHILGVMGVSVDEAGARAYLLETGNDCLFREPDGPPQARLLARAMGYAATAFANLADKHKPFTLSYSILSDGREVCWDIAPARW